MMELLAPNGKPSNLTAEQYKLVRTPAFKEWFGDWEKLILTKINDSGIDEISLKRLEDGVSKIIDNNGEPLPVYHGTSAEPFVVFDGGSFFTDDYMNADGYASGEMVYEVFLNIKKPLIINAEGRKWDNLKNKYGNSTRDIVGQLDFEKYDGVIFNNINDNWFDDEMGDTQNVYFSINPEQIKLADGTNTTFDGSNPDIRYAGGGMVIQPIENKSALNYLSRTSDGYGQFIGKNGKLFYIQFDKNDFTNPSVKVFDGEKLNNALSDGYGTGWIAIAFFNVDFKNKTFSGYLENDSIQVGEEYRRLGIATAMTDFAEEKLGMKYVPSKLLSKEMQGFVNNRFNYEKGGDVKINPTEIECHTCHWKWKVKDGGDDLFICHKCYADNTKYYKFDGLEGEKILDTISSNNNNPKNQFDGGGILDGLTDEQVTYIDIISNYDGKGALAEKYKKVLKDKTGIDYDEYYGKIDNDLIKNADVNNIKTKNDFLNYDNWIKYSYEILRKRGFDKNPVQHIEGKLTFDKIKEFCDNLNISFEIIPENLGVGNYASHSMGTIKVPIGVNINTFIHEIGHFYDWKIRYEGIAKNPAYATSFYILRNANEVYAENFMHYFIANEWLKNNMPIVYEELDRTISLEYKKNILELINSLNHFKKGGRTIAQTPAPKKDQIKGSDKNKEGSSKDLTSAKKIELSDSTIEAIKNKVDKHNEKHPKKKITIDSAKAVVRRGMGAYSSSHRPTIKGGNPNSRVAWGLARLNAFLYKIVNGKSKSGKYSQDNDLIEELGYKVQKYEIGGIFQGTPYDFNAYSTDYMGTGEGNQVFGWGLYFTDIKDIAKNYAKNELLIQKEIVRKSDSPTHLWIYTNISDNVVDKLGYLKIKLKEFEELKKQYKKDIWDDKIEIYSTLIEIIQNYQGKIYSVTLFKGEKESDYDLIQWEKPLGVDDLIKIFDEAEKIDGIDFKDGWELDEKYGLTNQKGNKVTGEEMYRWLSKKLDGDKEASLFLLRAGIDGIKYKAGTLSGMEDEEGYNYVIFDANDITIENKEKFADGGDIQAYEQAMGISEFKEGGEAKPKKVYVSIRLPYKTEKLWKTGDSLENFNKYFNTYDEKPFEELKNGKLEGLVGVSSSPNNIAEWFTLRDCLIVMNYEEFIAINETETINYYDPYQLMKNNLFLFKRLYANVGARSSDEESPSVFRQTLTKILEKIVSEIILEMILTTGQKYSELYRISRFLSPYETSAFPDWIEKKSIKIESPVDLTNAILDFNKLNDNWLGSGYENPVLTFDELLPVVEKGITNASSVYYSEQEIVLTNRELNIPKNSQLFFRGKDEYDKLRESNLTEQINQFNLSDKYRIHFIDSRELIKYRTIWLKKEELKFNTKFEKGREDLELKKEQVVNEILNIFIDKSINSFKIEYEKNFLSEYSELKTYYNNESDDYEEIFWYDIDLVQFIINTYIEIIKVNWKRFIESKDVKDLNLYSFSNFCSEVEYELKDFFEQNKDKLEKISDYRESKGNGYLSLYGFEVLLKKSVNHYESLPEWFDYKKLSKLYLEKMGVEIYRYYDKKDLPLISQYKNGGKTDEPTEFWGTEAGGVLVYCSTTERYLILLRSEWVLEPNTWGVISGKLDDDETNIEDAVLREVEEEVGYKLNNLIPSFIFEKTNFKFHNFVAIINEEFIPELNWENTDYKWVTLNDMPDNLHFGLKLLIQKEDLQKLVEKNNTMNKNQNPKDTITMDIPLLIRFSELMREEIKTDVALHEVVENLLEIKDKGVLTMSDYDSIVGNVTGTEEDVEQVIQPEQEKMAEGGKVQSIHSAKGDIKINLDENWYSDDTNVQLVPVSELIKFREFDRKVSPKYNQENSKDNINHLKYMFQSEGVKSPLIIEYSPKENAVLIIEGNHRLNSAIDLGMEFLPARVVLKKYGTYSPEKLKSTMKVSGVTPNLSGYIPSDLKPSVVGIQGTLPIYADGGIIEGRLHSECGDDGCGRKFQVGENGHVIEAERDEAVIVADAFDDNENYTIKGTPSEVASAINVIGGGKNFDRGATIIKKGQELEIPELKKQATDTDVADVIDSGSIIINRRSMADEKEYEVTGTPKQIASAINSINGNGVIIEEGAEIKEN